jgi:hypothetical protein
MSEASQAEPLLSGMPVYFIESPDVPAHLALVLRPDAVEYFCGEVVTADEGHVAVLTLARSAASKMPNVFAEVASFYLTEAGLSAIEPIAPWVAAKLPGFAEPATHQLLFTNEELARAPDS